MAQSCAGVVHMMHVVHLLTSSLMHGHCSIPVERLIERGGKGNAVPYETPQVCGWRSRRGMSSSGWGFGIRWLLVPIPAPFLSLHLQGCALVAMQKPQVEGLPQRHNCACTDVLGGTLVWAVIGLEC